MSMSKRNRDKIREKEIERSFNKYLLLLPSIFIIILWFSSFYISTNQFANSVLLEQLKEFLQPATFIYALLTIPLPFAVGLFLAILLHGRWKRLRDFTSYYAISGITYTVASICWLFVFHPTYGIFQRLLIRTEIIEEQSFIMSLITTNVLNLGFIFILSYGALSLLNQELLDNAAVTGVSYAYKIWKMMIPLLFPILLFIFALMIVHVMQLVEFKENHLHVFEQRAIFYYTTVFILGIIQFQLWRERDFT